VKSAVMKKLEEACVLKEENSHSLVRILNLMPKQSLLRK